jgi:hypothetical protein
MNNHIRSDGIEESEIIYMDLYPNRWAFSIKMRVPAGGDLLRCSV